MSKPWCTGIGFRPLWIAKVIEFNITKKYSATKFSFLGLYAWLENILRTYTIVVLGLDWYYDTILVHVQGCFVPCSLFEEVFLKFLISFLCAWFIIKNLLIHLVGHLKWTKSKFLSQDFVIKCFVVLLFPVSLGWSSSN